MKHLFAPWVLVGFGTVQAQSLDAAVEAARRGQSYDVTWHTGMHVEQPAWSAEHPVLDLRARFQAGAIDIEPASGRTWRWSLQLASLSRGERVVAVSAHTLAVDRDVVTLGRGIATEQFVHLAAGWEHTLSIAAGPARSGDQPLEARFALATDLQAIVDADARGASFFDDCGRLALDYRGLSVWDAAGRCVPARIELERDALRITIDDEDAQYPLLVDPVISTSEAKLLSSSSTSGSYAGGIVAIDGDTAVVSERFNTWSTRFAVFERGASGWAHTASISIVGGGANADLDGDWLLIGDGYYGWTGEAWLYHRVGSTWVHTPGLECPVPSLSCEPQTFGICVDIEGNTAVVGETERTCPFGPSVYIGEFNAATQHWRYQSRIPQAGIALALDGDDLLVAGYQSVRHYRRNGFGAPFVQVSTLATYATYWTVRGVGLDDGIAVLRYGALNKAEIYELHGSQFVLAATVPLSPGSSVGLNTLTPIVDGLAAIGDWSSDLVATDAGAVQLWSRNAGWSLVGSLTASDGAAGDGLGIAIDLDRRAPARTARLIAGAPQCDVAGISNRGAGYLFDLEHPSALVYCTSKINSQNCIPRIAFSGSPSASSSAAFTIQCREVINEKPGVFFYGTNGRLAAPFQGSYRCVASPTRRTGQMFTGGNSGTTDCSGVLSLDFNAHIQSGLDVNLIAGAVVNGQFWYRDGPALAGTGLSEAIELEIEP